MAKRIIKKGRQIRANSTVVWPPRRRFCREKSSAFRHLPVVKTLVVTVFVLGACSIEMSPEMQAEGFSRVTMEIEPTGDVTKLTVTQEIDFADSKLIEFTRGGWPMVLSSLKSLLETGQSFAMTRSLPRGM